MAGWTSYHDGLVTELVTLMTEPSWYSNATITNRVSAIQAILDGTATTLETVRDPDTGDSISHQELVNRLMEDAQTAYDEGIVAIEARYSQLVDGYTLRVSQVLGSDPTDWTATRTEFQSSWLADVIAELEERKGLVEDDLDGLGDEQLSDVGRRYNAERARVNASMIARGMFNSTILDSMLRGVEEAETQDRARVYEQIRRERMSWRSQIRMDLAQAYQALHQALLAWDGTGVQLRAGLLDDKFGVIERRTDTLPTLADIANLGLQLGRGSAQMAAIPSFGALTSYQPRTAAGEA